MIILYCLSTSSSPRFNFVIVWKRVHRRPLSLSCICFKDVMVKKYLSDAYFKSWSYGLTSQPGGMFFHHHLTSNGSKSFVYPHGRRPPFNDCINFQAQVVFFLGSIPERWLNVPVARAQCLLPWNNQLWNSSLCSSSLCSCLFQREIFTFLGCSCF